MRKHNSLIGQLGYYSSVEVTRQAADISKEGAWPYSWENSESLTNQKRSREKSRRRRLRGRLRRYRRMLKIYRERLRQIPKIYRDRLVAISLLIVIPGLGGAVIGAFMIAELWAFLCGLVGMLIALRAGLFLVDSALHRSFLRDKIAESPAGPRGNSGQLPVGKV
jgi:hypothetical protein